MIYDSKKNNWMDYSLNLMRRDPDIKKIFLILMRLLGNQIRDVRIPENQTKRIEAQAVSYTHLEKPFQGVNGSGKHNNWSLTSDTGINMLEPGVTPHENIQFLLVLACIMKAVDVHADLLRQSAAVPGNDYRLGAQEAPPAIISIFVGEQIEDVIDQLCSTGSATHSKMGGKMCIRDSSRIPDHRRNDLLSSHV